MPNVCCKILWKDKTRIAVTSLLTLTRKMKSFLQYSGTVSQAWEHPRKWQLPRNKIPGHQMVDALYYNSITICINLRGKKNQNRLHNPLQNGWNGIQSHNRRSFVWPLQFRFMKPTFTKFWGSQHQNMFLKSLKKQSLFGTLVFHCCIKWFTLTLTW